MKTLLVGSSFSAMPLLFDLKCRGHEIAVIGKHRGDPCHSYADRSIFEDYSNQDALLQICREDKFDFIVPSCNDYSYVAATSVANQLGFPGFDSVDVAEVLHVKDNFRRFCRALGVPAPAIYGEASVDTSYASLEVSGPVLVKPVDSFSGRGVQLVRDPSEIPTAISEAFKMSRHKRAVIEQFVEGALHSHTGFISDGRFIWHDFVDEFCEVYPYQVDRSKYPSQLSRSLKARVHDAIAAIASELQLANGLLHTQFIASANDFWIIECMRRCPGDLYGHHFRLGLNYDYESQYVSSFVGEKPILPNFDLAPKSIERRVVSTQNSLSFFAIDFNLITRDSLFIPLKNSGERMEAAPFDKAGILFSAGENAGLHVKIASYNLPCPNGRNESS